MGAAPLLSEAIATMASTFGDAVAVVDDDLRMSFRALEDRSARLAGFISERVPPGGRVAYLGRNSWQLIVAIFACAYSRTVLVPVNWRLAADELDAVLSDAAPGLSLTGEDDDSILGAEPVRLEAADDLEPVVQMYTAGFGGRALGALLTHRGLVAQVREFIAFNGLGADDAYLASGPLFHIGTMFPALAALMSGGKVVIMDRFDPAAAAGLIQQERITGLFLVEPMNTRLLEVVERDGFDVTSLRRGVGGTSPASQRLRAIAGIPAWGNVFGQTEVTGIVTRPDPGAIGTHGRQSPIAEIRILDDGGRDLPPGEVGEIVVRGPTVMLGYANDAAATADKIRDGWLHSYDLGRIESDGSLSFIGPKRMLIKSGGENVYPAEVENAILAMDRVAQVCVIGLPHPQWGQVVTAVIVPREGARLIADDVEAHCRRSLAGYKVPRRVEFVDALPATGDGRIDRDALTARFEKGV
ncbi:MAG: class I adenylate-forming enzyme family protein [Actinomycetota bacterium]